MLKFSLSYSDSHDVGSVGCLKNIRSAISVARSVMVHTDHTLLVGEDGKLQAYFIKEHNMFRRLFEIFSTGLY